MRSTFSLQYEPAPVRLYMSIGVYPVEFAGNLVDTQADNSVMEVDYVRCYEPLEASKTDLEKAIDDVTNLITNAVVGTANGNYSQDSINALTNAKNTTNTTFIDSQATQGAINTALDTFNSAIEVFLQSVVGVIRVTGVAFDTNSTTQSILMPMTLLFLHNKQE